MYDPLIIGENLLFPRREGGLMLSTDLFVCSKTFAKFLYSSIIIHYSPERNLTERIRCYCTTVVPLGSERLKTLTKPFAGTSGAVGGN